MYQQEVSQRALGTGTGAEKRGGAAGDEVTGYLSAKRTVDVALSILALLITSPFLLVIAIAVKLDSRGPVLFKQTRIGMGGKPFTFRKFRTMFHNADPEIHRQYVQALIHQRDGTNGGATAAPVYKIQKDPRITRVGAFLRRTSLDELPQFFNVLMGEMSLVGPRPPLPYEVQEYQDWHMARLAALPGITGLWQVRGRSRVTFDEMVRMDIEYIAKRSLWLDMKILLLTIPAVLAGQGAM